MAFDAFLKIDGIDGESTVQGFEKWIELLSFSWGAVAANESAAAAGRGAGAGRVTAREFTFMKLTDSASPLIFVKMTQGANFQKMSVACRMAGETAAGAPQDAFIKFDFSNVFVSSFNEGGNTSTDQRPMESISFVYSSIEFQSAALSPDGTLGQFNSGGFDFTKNKEA